MRNRRFPGSHHPPPVAKALGTVFGLIFAGIGILVIGFLWSQPFGQFGAPPLFFRLFGSLIALAFIAMGSATAYTAICGYRSAGSAEIRERFRQQSDAAGPHAYSCPRCGAPLAENADVSPHGDVKCSHCGGWFNVHHA